MLAKRRQHLFVYGVASHLVLGEFRLVLRIADAVLAKPADLARHKLPREIEDAVKELRRA